MTILIPIEYWFLIDRGHVIAIDNNRDALENLARKMKLTTYSVVAQGDLGTL